MHSTDQSLAAPAPATISSVAPDSTTAALAAEVPKETPAPAPVPAVAPTPAVVPEAKPEAPAAPTEGAMSATSGPLSDEPHLAAH